MFALALELHMTVEQVQHMRVDEYHGWQWYFSERRREHGKTEN